MFHPVKLHIALVIVLLGSAVLAVPIACKRSTPTTMSYELIGKHLEVSCEGCHGASLDTLPTDCSSCHLQDRPQEHDQNPCELCHTPMGWGAGEAHDFFPLEEAHALTCTECHAEDRFDDLTGQSEICGSCHEQVRPEAHHPEQDCILCHTPTAWGDMSMLHSFLPLEGAHALECTDCHAEDRFDDLTGQATVCASCHETERPEDHHPGEDCGKCHVPTNWGDATMDHSFFPLEHGHELKCVECHTTEDTADLAGLGEVCTTCHERPSGHFDNGTSCFAGQDCSNCHETTSWGVAEINHSACSQFPTRHEANSPRPCGACHPSAPNYRSFDCNDCHANEMENYEQEWHSEHDNDKSFTDQAGCLASGCHPDGQED